MLIGNSPHSNAATAILPILQTLLEEPSEQTVFVTSTTYSGDLGGLGGGDAICQAHAVDAGLRGTYRAWLSSGVDSPSTRFNQATVPYKRVDGVTIADNWADLTDGNMDAPLNIDEFGNLQMDPMDKDFAWTNTDAFGTRATIGAHCSSWTSTAGVGQIGNLSHSAGGWTFFGLMQPSCSQMHHLYCFEQ